MDNKIWKFNVSLEIFLNVYKIKNTFWNLIIYWNEKLLIITWKLYLKNLVIWTWRNVNISIYTDKTVNAFSDATCQAACSAETEFICRSYTFRSQSRSGSPQCLLSGDNTASAGKNAFQIESGALFSEKKCGLISIPRRDSTFLMTRPQVLYMK